MDDEDDEEFLQNMARQEAARQVGTFSCTL
jgi:hypothetical protein